MAYKYVKRTSAKARKRPGKSYVPKGKKPRLGSGGRFKALESAISKRKGVTNPGAIAAMIGRKKYGKAKFQKMAAAGRHRAAVKRHRTVKKSR